MRVVYYESINRELKTKLMYECRCDERLKTKVEESTRLTCTVLHDKTNQKHLEIKMRSTSEKSGNAMGERAIQRRRPPHRHPSRHEKPKPSSGRHRPLPHVTKKTLLLRKWHCHGIVARTAFLKLKQKSEAPQRKPRPHVPTQISMRRPPHPNHTRDIFLFIMNRESES